VLGVGLHQSVPDQNRVPRLVPANG
jgi:hypothetical protein